MRKEEITGMTIAGLSTIIMVLITNLDAFESDNWLMIILLIFAIVTIVGLGLTKLFYGGKSNDKEIVDDFIGNN